MEWFRKWFERYYGYDTVLEELRAAVERNYKNKDLYHDEIENFKKKFAKLHELSTEPKSECTKVKHYTTESAEIHLSRMEKITQEPFTIYKCDVCPIHPITLKQFYHVAHSVPSMKRLKERFNGT